MSGRRRGRRGTHAGNTATAEGRSHQGGRGGGEGGGSNQPIAGDDPMVGVGGGGGGRAVRTATAATPGDGGLHLGAEGGKGGSSPILPAAAAIAARTEEERQSQVATDRTGQAVDAESSDDQTLLSRKGACFLNEDEEANVAADGNGHDCSGESSDDQALVSPKGSCFGGAVIKLPPSEDVHDQSGCDSGPTDGQPCTLAEKKEGQVTADDGERCIAGGNGGDQVMNSWSGGCFLLDAVMSWRVDDVMNADLFKKEVEKIPSTFSSIQHYLSIHRNLLLEETRASISIGLDIVKEKMYHALSITQTSTPFVFFIDIDLKKSSDCLHIAEDGDLFLLSTLPHGELDDASGCFAIAIEVGRYSCFLRGFRVLVSKHHTNFDFRAVKHVSFLTNIMGGINLSKAMTSIECGASNAIESILRIDEKANTKVCSCGELELDEFSHPNKFNEKQINALKCILSKLKCPHIKAPEVLWGPPGSGKTEIAAAMIHLLSQWKFRVLVCLPREKDILILLDKFKVLFPVFNLSEILVLNDMSAVENCYTFSKMSLENRAQELYCCTYSWRSWVKELCFVLNMEPYCQDNCYHEGCICTENNLLIFRLESFREKICALILDFRECSKDLVSSLSGKCFFDNDVANIKELMTELSLFKDLIQNDSLDSSDVQWAFGFSRYLHPGSEVTKRDIAQSLNAKIMSCLRLIEILLNSFELPQLEDRKELEDFCLGHSRVIICTPSHSSRLLQLKLTPFDTLIVDDASQIKESDLLLPLSMAPKNVVLIGDHLHLQPTVKSEVCKRADYASSLFERLLHLFSERMMLAEQYMMHPSISLFVRGHFYEGKCDDASNVCSHDYTKKLVVGDSKLSPYCLFDITGVDELRVKGKRFVECAAIISALEWLCKDLANGIGKLSVAVLCLSSSHVDTMKNRLGRKYGSHNRINLEVNTLDNANEDWYDVVIFSSVFDAKSELPEGNRLNIALTKSRHFLWIMCEGNNLLESGGTWEMLVKNAKERHIFGKLTSKNLSNVMKMLEVDDQKRPTSTNSAFTGNIMQKPGQEWTWKGRPNNTKDILGSLRDQKNARDTCTLQAFLTTTESLNKYQYSSLDPPQDFPWELCFNDLQSKYEKVVGEEIASEEIGKKRGKYRQETSFEIGKTQGIIGRSKAQIGGEQERLFKLESYERVDETMQAEAAELLVQDGSMMVCNFRLSRNYFRLRPGEVYVYDRRYPYIHARSGLPVSHAVTVIGHGGRPRPRVGHRHVHIQNSEGKRVGDDGFGRVAWESVRGLYRLTLPPLVAAAPPLLER